MEDHVSNIPRCVICMIEFNVGDSVRYLPCMHIYHVEVLIFLSSTGLPLKRKSLPPFLNIGGRQLDNGWSY